MGKSQRTVTVASLNRRTGKPRIKTRRMRDFGCYWVEEKTIDIRKGLRSKTHLNTLIHEMLHHFNPDWYEYKVRNVAKHMTDVLWKARYRRVERQ